MNKPLIAIFLPSLMLGGAEKALVELANNLDTDKWRIHLIVMSKNGHLIESLCVGVELIDLRSNSFRHAILALRIYYKSYKPSIVLTSLYATGLAAIIARLISWFKPKIIIGAHNSLQAKVANPDNDKDKWLLMPLCRLLFPLADGLIAVSRGLAKELNILLNIPKQRIKAIYNPVINNNLCELASEPVSHPWLNVKNPKEYKTFVAVGRLVEQKGYDILLKAMQLTRINLDCRLIIVGGGPLLSDLEKTASHLGISDFVDFVGWQINPYKFIAKADLFILSSRWEGLANVLIEALACGVPVVSTNCRYGPEEILEHGKYGALANVDDPVDLAEKITSSLNSFITDKSNAVGRISRGLDFTVEASAKQYDEYFSELLNNKSGCQKVNS